MESIGRYDYDVSGAEYIIMVRGVHLTWAAEVKQDFILVVFVNGIAFVAIGRAVNYKFHNITEAIIA